MRASSSSYNDEICRYFANGICSKGNSCKFKHDEKVRSEYVCQFFLAGKCSFGHTCRFKHQRPQTTSSGPSSSSTLGPSSQPSTFSTPRIRPVRLEKPGLNVKAEEFVPSWLKAEPKEVKMSGTGISYAAAAAASAPISKDTMSSLSQDVASRMMCPYHETNGDCNRKDGDCPFAHGDLCDMCNQYSLHPTDAELRERHRESCLQNHQDEMERAFLLQESAKKVCGICLECIVEKNLRFGILNGCRHCFCLSCIREWRTRDLQDQNMVTKTVRSCPECRQHSDYVIPSLFWVEQGREKETLIAMYKDNMKSKICKYYSSTDNARGQCKFGNKCFYKHQRPDGTIDPGRAPHARRQPRLVEFIFPQEFDYYSSSDEDADDGGGAPIRNVPYSRARAEREAEMQAFADDIGISNFQDQFYAAMRIMIREAQQRGHGAFGGGSPSGGSPYLERRYERYEDRPRQEPDSEDGPLSEED